MHRYRVLAIPMPGSPWLALLRGLPAPIGQDGPLRAMRRANWHRRVALGTLVQRIPAALFFFVLLGQIYSNGMHLLTPGQ